KDRFLRVRCGPRCPQVLYALDGCHRFPIYWTGNPLLVFGFDFDKLNALEIHFLAILDSFCMMKVRDLLLSPEEQVLPLFGAEKTDVGSTRSKKRNRLIRS
ncbi:hypothetical protein KIW84_023583, partial [Lathyrus oleraceus]